MFQFADPIGNRDILGASTEPVWVAIQEGDGKGFLRCPEGKYDFEDIDAQYVDDEDYINSPWFLNKTEFI